MNLFVSGPDIVLHDAFLKMLNDYNEHDPENGSKYCTAQSDFIAYVQNLNDDEQGLIGIVPCTHRWLVNTDGAIVGVVRVKHHINTDFLANEIGHIGFDVPPSHRGNGYGAMALKTGLDIAKAVGLTNVVLYADTDNSASWHTIERCGGVFDVEKYSLYYRCLVRRYLIALR